MAENKLLHVLKEEMNDLPPEIDADALNRILTGPEQKSLAEAITADAIDVLPIVGQITLLIRKNRAEKEGVKYPSEAAFVDLVFGDLGTPVEEIVQALTSPNTNKYLHDKYGIETPLYKVEQFGVKELKKAAGGSGSGS